MGGFDRLPESVEALYEAVLRSASLTTGEGGSVDPALVADLAIELTAGGAVRPLSDCTDLASTGGPGSISTMLVPLMTRAAGLPVAKVGVPGRPAGAVDALANVPGYRWSSTAEEFERAMGDCGFAHTAANIHWAPGDAALFQRRQVDGTQRIPALVVASLLSKKLSAGVRYPGFEVRAARHGNFGSTLAEVRRNSTLLCEVAERLGMHATVFVTAAELPHQPWIGRGEALAALSMACGGNASGQSGHDGADALDVDGWSTVHLRTCEQMASALVARVRVGDPARRVEAAGKPTLDQRDAERMRNISKTLTTHLSAHGAAREGLEAIADATVSAAREVLTAPRAGFVSYRIDRMRDHLVRVNAPASVPPAPGGQPFADRAGAVLHVLPGASVKSGTPIVSLRWPNGVLVPDARDLFEITHQPPTLRFGDATQLQETVG